MHRPVPESETTNSNGDLKPGALPPGRARLSGTVVLADGSAANELVDIYAECAGNRVLVATADSKGRFSVSRDSLRSITGTKACALHAFLDGYYPAAQPLADVKLGSDEKVGRLVLHPLSANANGFTSTADKDASKAQQKIYEKALDQAARTEWSSAIDSLRKVTSAYPQLQFRVANPGPAAIGRRGSAGCADIVPGGGKRRSHVRAPVDSGSQTGGVTR